MREVRKNSERRRARGLRQLPQGRRGCLGPQRIEPHGDEAGGKGRDPRGQNRESLALPKGEAPRVSGEIAPRSADVPCRPYLEKNEKSVEPSNDDPGGHTPPPPATHRGPTAARPPPLRCAHGSGPPRLRMEAPSTAMPAAPAVYAPRFGPVGYACVSLPPQFSRLCRLPFAAVAHAGCAVCPSRRCAYTASALGMAYRKVYSRRRVAPSWRRALRYGGWVAASSRSPAGGGGAWDPLVTGSVGA